MNIMPHQIAIGNILICSGTVLMVVPAGGAHVREVAIYLPAFTGDPSVTATVSNLESSLDPNSGQFTSPGNAFAIWDIKINHLANQTQIAVEACNVDKGQQIPPLGQPPVNYYCSYVVIGAKAK
jgi:hypothetical protein